MKASVSSEQETILNFVRGREPWTKLRTVGIQLDLSASSVQTKNTGGIVATADAYDVAEGLLTHIHDAEELRPWALILESGSDFLDLALEVHPAGEVLLDAVWKASFGDPIPDQAIRLAENLVNERRSRT
jgi:hypothetical protein